MSDVKRPFKIDVNGRPSHDYDQVGYRRPNRTPAVLTSERFARTAAVCSLARYLVKWMKLPPPTAKMVAAEALRFAENNAINEL